MGNVNGLSLDLLVHPGETIKEVLEEKKMSQEELAIRTEYSPKHISEVVRGKKDISSEFANTFLFLMHLSSSLKTAYYLVLKAKGRWLNILSSSFA